MNTGYSIPMDTISATSQASPIASVGTGLLWLLLAAALLLYIGFGAIVAYHWFRYAQDQTMATFTMIMYTLTGVALSAIMAGALITLS